MKKLLTKNWLLPAAAVLILVVLLSLASYIWFARGKNSTGEVFRYDNNGKIIELPEWILSKPISINKYSRPGEKTGKITGVVIHYVANSGSTAEQNRQYFDGLKKTHATYASSNFIIGLDGEIIECVPMGEVAYASNTRNHDTISVECCHPDETGKFTDATYESLVKLCRWLLDVYDLEVDAVIRHYDITGKICPKYFVEHEDEWREFLAELIK
jgi:N-acetylmuramoyl-L-alanine amidase